MPEIRSTPRRFAWWAIGETISNWVWSHWPVVFAGGPAVIGPLGYSEGYSLTLIFLFCLGSLAIIALCLNQYSQWRVVSSPADKVRFAGPFIGVNLDETQTPPKVKGIKLGITAHNAAPFPIDVRLDSLETQIENRIPSEEFASRTLALSMGALGHFANSQIDLSSMDLRNAALVAKIKGSISYGRSGKLSYKAEQPYWIALKFDENGQIKNAEVSVTQLVVA